MNRFYKLKHLIFSFLLGSIFFSGISFAAASSSNIEVYFQPLKYFFDGIEKKAPDDQQGFIYNGTTYVPLRFLTESLGKEVSWDGSAYSIFVGKQPQGQIIKFEDMKTHTAKSQYLLSKEKDNTQSLKGNTNDNYANGFYVGFVYGDPATGSEFQGSFINEYLLNDQYKEFDVVLAPSYVWNKRAKKANIGEVKIYGDDKLLTDQKIDSDITQPIKVNVDLKGVLKLRIEATGTSLGFFDPKFIQ